MSSESGALSRHEAWSGLRSLLRVTTAMALRRSSIVLLCLLGSGAAEGIGIASLIPLIVIAGDSSAAADIGNKSRIASNVTEALHSLGLATEPFISCSSWYSRCSGRPYLRCWLCVRWGMRWRRLALGCE
jgi:hypothetical protein